MEHIARLALVEQCVKDIDKFSKIMLKLLGHIINMLDQPHDEQLRIIKSIILKDYFKNSTAFSDYLKYVGYEEKGDDIQYTVNQSVSHLRIAQLAIERKVFLCGRTTNKAELFSIHFSEMKKKIEPAYCEKGNPFLEEIQRLFNNTLRYEDPELLAYAREKIPIEMLQIQAFQRIKEQKEKHEAGEIKEKVVSFEIALLMELMSWYKYQFFTWVDSPECQCGATTVLSGIKMQLSRGETCRVEEFKCTACGRQVPFPRYNNPRTLLDWRKGRCGEWANCFTLLCRALNFDVRYIYDVTDHVWCEVFDYESNSWLHCDPCEAKLNAPLMYAHGWGKRLSYVVAVSRDDVQDVTWRYTTNHKEILKRRTKVSERELIDGILRLRDQRQRQVSEARRLYLAKRAAIELVNLMVERKPEEFESHGRISGSEAWRRRRGETGAGGREPYVFALITSGEHSVRYDCAKDLYRVYVGQSQETRKSWVRGTYTSEHVFRKVEHDWKQAYLARTEGATIGDVSWRFAAGEGLICKRISVAMNHALYEDGKVSWTVMFDEEEPIEADFGANAAEFDRSFKSVTVRAVLSGGVGELAWQHAQLFRQSLNEDKTPFVISLSVVKTPDWQGDYSQTNHTV